LLFNKDELKHKIRSELALKSYFWAICLLGKMMNNKPDVLFLLAGVVALGALLTGFMAPDEAHTTMIISENLIR
jgi:hypothetical protein